MVECKVTSKSLLSGDEHEVRIDDALVAVILGPVDGGYAIDWLGFAQFKWAYTSLEDAVEAVKVEFTPVEETDF
jgi:hypothetical protein